MALTPLVNAQQFQTPTLPSPPTTAISLELQARLQHAEALKAQMLRAQQEQGAPSEFAIKAYEAQQAYQAQRAFDEYMAYQKKQKQLERRQPEQFPANQVSVDPAPTYSLPGIAPAAYQQPVNRFPIPVEQFEQRQPEHFPANQVSINPTTTNSMTGMSPAAYQEPVYRLPMPVEHTSAYPMAASQVPSQPSTFVPPVHIAPTVSPTQINIGNEPTTRSTTSDQSQSSDLQQVAYQRTASQQDRAPAQPLYASQPTQATADPSTQANVRPRRQLATTQRIISPQHSDPQPAVARQATTLNPPLSQTMYRQPEYILQENGYVGLQDRISSLLSKPRYRDSNSGQPHPAQSVSRLQFTEQPTAPANQAQQFVQTQPTRIPTPAVQQGRDADVQYAFEMQQPREQVNPNRRAVQNVMMIEPAQDPFNDQSVELPPSSNLRLQAPQDFYPSIPPDRQALAIPMVDENTPMRQISVLSNRSQDEGPEPNNQFGQPLRPGAAQQPNQSFQPPANNNASAQQEPFGIQSAEDQKKADDELNRRFQELEGKSGDETSRFDDMVKQLEQELEQGRMEQKDSVIGDGLESRFGRNLDGESQGIKSNLKTCDEFRNELLKGSIRDISMDMSPLASRNRSQGDAISRSWTDRAGNIVATGTMVDLRRGYVIIDGADGRQRIPYAKLSDADWAAISEYWKIPELCSVGNQGDASRSWVPQTFTWQASSLCHKPLFFENVQLERYGHTHGPIAQPIRSVAHFFVSFVTVPYQSGIHPATECQYALGFYRPGDCAPWLKNPIPFSLNGAARQAIITTGVAVIP